MPLERETAFFESHLNEWMKDHEGEYALIKDEEVRFYPTGESAYAAGLELWGEVPMLIKRVQQNEGDERALALLCDLIHVQG